jgi:hypothetical protein
LGLSITYHLVPDLPKLAWVASLDLKTFTEVSVFHGSSVECRDTWMVEGVWDGDFSSGNFHKAENVFGSGIRIDGERIYFVPSCALVDHLFYCIHRERLLVSNSLTVLLGCTGATLDDKHDYYNEGVSILNGIKEYKKGFLVIHPEIERFYQVFYENIVVTKDGILFELKNGLHDITSFEQYYTLFWSILSRIKDNYQDPERTIPLSAFSTISSGYDSTAVTCLAKHLGVNTCFTVRKSASWMQWSSKYSTDDGTLAAQALNLNIIYADASRSEITDDELFFLSINYGRSENHILLNEIAFSSMVNYIEQNCSSAVLFTGYHGDKVWDINTPEQYLGEELKLSSVCLGFSEIRLKSGFINVAVPFILARNIRSLVAISRSDEMKPWSLGNDYDRPIARRIAESSGVPREAFGMQKKGVSRHMYRLPLSRKLRKLFLQYLKKQYDFSPLFVYANHALNQSAFLFQKVMMRVFRPTIKHRRSTVFWPNLDISFLMWIWATHLLSERMDRALKNYTESFSGAREDPGSIRITKMATYEQNGRHLIK